MPEKPLIVFPEPEQSSRIKQHGGSSSINYPSRNRQRERLQPKFDRLQEAFQNRRAELQQNPTGISPEQVIVFETVGDIEKFVNAVRYVDGMEWLVEFEPEEMPPDEDFYYLDSDDERREDKNVRSKLFLVMSNYRALEELLSLWQLYQENPDESFRYGLNKFKNLFKQLYDIRKWNYQDRLEDTGILDDWSERIENEDEEEIGIPFEIEIWHRATEEKRNSAVERLNHNLSSIEGHVINEVDIPEIRYHGLLVEVPLIQLNSVINNDMSKNRFFNGDDIMFFRPVGQSSVVMQEEAPEEEVEEIEKPVPENDEPIIALLDGFPIQNHRLLRDRITIDDPDDYQAGYSTTERFHGTSMASIIIHGDLTQNLRPQQRKIYLRPILKPDNKDWRVPRTEIVPEDTLFIDQLHRSVRRLFEGEGKGEPIAPNIKVINLSIGDKAKLFQTYFSPLSRLIDWLSDKYNVLFIVSAGNHSNPIEIEIPNNQTQNDIQQETLKAIADDNRNRRLLSPAESINALTIGASHSDRATIRANDRRINLIQNENLASPLSALGPGFRRSVKPDILFPGGRQFYLNNTRNLQGGKTAFQMHPSSQPPGIKTARPGSAPTDLNAVGYSTGTSNAAAFASYYAGVINDLIEELRTELGGEQLTNEYVPVIIKTLLSHGATWRDVKTVFAEIIDNDTHWTKTNQKIANFIGYGSVDVDWTLNCTDERATIIGCGNIGNDEGHLFKFPLPTNISGRRMWKRITLTLSWMSPLNFTNKKYRKAQLWFDIENEDISYPTRDTDPKLSMRGTLQHQILEDDGILALLDGEDNSLDIKVSCRADAGNLSEDERIRYALAATLEIAEEENIAIYDEIREKIRPRVQVRPTE